MSNSIAPGSSADVNVKVTALNINPNVPAQYKTIILKKNLVNGVNTLTQAMMNQTNTKYVIKYDYILGEDITIPENCVLEFDGGSLSGAYTITGDNTSINAGIVKIFNNNIILDGTWAIDVFYAIWYGIAPNTNDDFGESFQTMFDNILSILNIETWSAGHNFGGITIKLLAGRYTSNSTIYLTKNDICGLTISGDTRTNTEIVLPSTSNATYIFDTYNSVGKVVTDLIIENIVFRGGNRKTALRLYKPWRTFIKNCSFRGCVGINLHKTVNTFVENCTFVLCTKGIHCDGSLGVGLNTTLYIINSWFQHCKQTLLITDLSDDKTNPTISYIENSTFEFSTAEDFEMVLQYGKHVFNNCHFEGNANPIQCFQTKVDFIDCHMSSGDAGIKGEYAIIPSYINWRSHELPVIKGRYEYFRISTLIGELFDKINKKYIFKAGYASIVAPGFLYDTTCVRVKYRHDNDYYDGILYRNNAGSSYMRERQKIAGNINYLNTRNSVESITEGKIYFEDIDSSQDCTLEVYEINADMDVFNEGTTSERPQNANSLHIGFQYFDTTLGKPIYVKTIDTSTTPVTITWVDATGTPV